MIENRETIKEFAEAYVKEHTYFNSRAIAKEFSNLRHNTNPDKKLTWSIGQVLRVLRVNGEIEKYNARQWIKIEKKIQI